MRNGRWLAVLAIIGGLMPAYAEIYKWVDEHGRVHYTDKPNEQAETLNINDRAESTESPADESARREHRQRLLKSMQQERERKQEQREQTRAAQEAAKQKCVAARAELTDITRAGFLFRRNTQGERVIFTDEERAQATAQAEAAVKQHCGG